MRQVCRLTAVFSEPSILDQALARLHGPGISLVAILSPFPVPSPQQAATVGWRTTRVAAAAGILSAVAALSFQIWVMESAWPLNFGGRPWFAGPALVPVTFEVGVLGAGLAAFLHFLGGLGKSCPIVRRELPPDGFVVVADVVSAEQAGRLRRELMSLQPELLEWEDRWED